MSSAVEKCRIIVESLQADIETKDEVNCIVLLTLVKKAKKIVSESGGDDLKLLDVMEKMIEEKGYIRTIAKNILIDIGIDQKKQKDKALKQYNHASACIKDELIGEGLKKFKLFLESVYPDLVLIFEILVTGGISDNKLSLKEEEEKERLFEVVKKWRDEKGRALSDYMLKEKFMELDQIGENVFITTIEAQKLLGSLARKSCAPFYEKAKSGEIRSKRLKGGRLLVSKKDVLRLKEKFEAIEKRRKNIQMLIAVKEKIKGAKNYLGGCGGLEKDKSLEGF